MAFSLKSERGPTGPLLATYSYRGFDPTDRVVYTLS
jgi:hypothetical protein